VTKTFGNAPFTLTAPTATGVGGAAVAGAYTYVSSDTGVATVSGSVVTIVGAGSTTLTATFTPTSGDYASGQTVTATLTVNKANQAPLVMTSPSTATFGETITLASSGGSGTGTVSYGIVAGTCTIEGTTLTLGNAGSVCQVSATKQTDANFNTQTSATQTITISQAGQTLAFTSSVPASPLPNGTYTPTASAISTVTGLSSGVTPTFTAAGACSLAGGVVTFTVMGTCTITASAGSNTNFTAAVNVTQVIAVGSLNQNITFAQPSNQAFGSSSFSLGATASSGLPVAYVLGAGTTIGACSVSSLGVVTILAVGTCEAVASQAGDAQYAAASSVTRAFQVVPALPTAPTLTSASASSQAITVGVVPPGFTGGVSITAYEVVATPVTVGAAPVVTSTACTASPCTITGLTNGVAYTVKVAAINSAGTGPYSGSTGALTPATAAFAVGALSATPGNEEVVLNWVPLTNDQLGGGSFTNYRVSFRDPEVSLIWTVVTNALTNQSDSTFTVTGLTNSVSYDFQVIAITSANATEIPGNTAEVVQYPSTAPSAPQSPVVLAATATDVQFSWSAPLSDGGSVLTVPNYTVTVVGSAGAAAVACDPGNTGTNCIAVGLTNGASYEFAVVANNRMGASPAATVTYNVPSSNATLSDLEVTSSGGAVALTPVFDAAVLLYTASVTNAITSVTVTPTATDAGATVTVNGVAVASGEPSQAIALQVGTNVIEVEVTATDPRFSETYTITITRAAAPPSPSGGGSGGVAPGVPVVPPAPVMNGDQVGAVTVNGQVQSGVVLVETSSNSGWEIVGEDFTLAVDTESANRTPESLLPNGFMQVPQGGFVALSGTGYAPESTVAVFAIPKSDVRAVGKRALRAMANAVWLGSTTVGANGAMSVVFSVPTSMNTGDYVLQVNGETTEGQMRSVNLQLVVEPAMQMREQRLREAAFFQGKEAVLSRAGEQRLRSLVSAIPKNATDVVVNVIGVSIALDGPRANLRLARDRAQVITDYLIASGVAGEYNVSITTTFTVDGPQRAADTQVKNTPLNSPAYSSAGKPLTTAAVSFAALTT
jgi:outer membrane protein OmpA-like peptidoglycan-associated protein